MQKYAKKTAEESKANTGEKQPQAQKEGIKVLPDGPYELTPDLTVQIAAIVSNDEGESLDWSYGKTYPNPQPGKPVHLCRCGHSHHTPFCDGTHVKDHFNGTETADKTPYAQAAIHYEGAAVDLYDQEKLCAVARFCDVGDGVWAYAEQSDDPKNKAMAIREACHCPSGRLTVVEKDGTPIEPDLEQRVSPVQDTANNMRGPLWVQGGVPLEGADGEAYETRNRMTLCRCGESANKPFCDGRHLRCQHMEGKDE